MRAQSRLGRRRCAFTFVELCIGLVIVSILMGAMAAFSLATAEAWKQGSATNAVGSGQNVAAIPLIANLVAVRIDNEIGGCAGVGGYYSGTLTSSSGQQASLLLWKKDTNGNTTIEPSEVELLEYNATDHCIYKYTSTATTPSLTYDQFTASWIATFKDPSMSSKVPLARNIDGMQINVSNASRTYQLPLVEYRLYFSRGGQAQTRYGAVCVRSPIRASGQTLN